MHDKPTGRKMIATSMGRCHLPLPGIVTYTCNPSVGGGGGLRQRYCGFQARQGYIVRSCLKYTKLGWVWWHIPLVPSLRSRDRKADL